MTVQVYDHPEAEETIGAHPGPRRAVLRPPDPVLVYRNLGVRRRR